MNWKQSCSFGRFRCTTENHFATSLVIDFKLKSRHSIFLCLVSAAAALSDEGACTPMTAGVVTFEQQLLPPYPGFLTAGVFCQVFILLNSNCTRYNILTDERACGTMPLVIFVNSVFFYRVFLKDVRK